MSALVAISSEPQRRLRAELGYTSELDNTFPLMISSAVLWSCLFSAASSAWLNGAKGLEKAPVIMTSVRRPTLWLVVPMESMSPSCFAFTKALQAALSQT